MIKDRIRGFFETLLDTLPIILGIISAIITIVQFCFGQHKAWLIINLFLLFSLVSSNYIIQRKSKIASGLTLLAKDGHIHTTRMLILHDNYEKIAKHHNNYENITKQNDFYAQSVCFSFHIKKRNKDGLSTQVYQHHFSFLPLHNGEKIFAPWFFGEDEAVPTDCSVQINQQNWQPAIPKPVVEGTHDYSVNEGIYTASIPLGLMKRPNHKDVCFKYVRNNSFRWDREEIFVIWPKCYAKKMEKASFSVSFDEDVQKVVQIIEYVCHGRRPEKKIKAYLEKQHFILESNAAAQYCVTDLDINPDNVYVIYITDNTSPSS